MNDASRSAIPVATPADEAVRWRFGNVVFDETTFQLSVGGEARELTRKPLELLMYLIRNPGEVVTKDEIFEAVWPGRIVSETSLTNAIGRLRTALGDGDQDLIRAVYGYGYRFTGEPMRDSTSPVKVEPPSSALELRDGDPVPRREGWVLRRRLGAGGAGEAWLGYYASERDTRVFKFARDRSALTALKREITLSRLMREGLGERQDLVRVLDWSLDEPPFFIALEYCSEGSLVDWSERQGGIHLVPPAQRLELIAEAAEALAGAHQVGVLHKDLKPSNLLLHKDGESRLILKLADFGSARLVDRDRLLSLSITQLGFTQTLTDASSGTPLYLAPELLSGSPPTTRSDVYALGVMLYQLVIGDLRRPLAPGWERNVGDPLLIEDISEAAAGDPQQRLADAAQLAIRLRTLDERRAVRERQLAEARSAEATRLALERSRARRSLLIGLAASLVAGLVATSGLYVRANRARVEAIASAAMAQSEAARANAVAAFLTDDLLSAGNPEIAGRRNVSVREVLDRAQSRLEGRFKDQPRVEATLTRILGTAYAGLNEREPAERLLLSAEHLLTERLGPAANETQVTRMRLRDLYLDVLEWELATKTLERVLEAENAAGRPNLDMALEADAQARIVSCWGGFISVHVARCDEVADEGYRLALEKLGPHSRATLSAAMDAGDTRLKNGRGAAAVPFFRLASEGLQKFHPDGGYLTLLSGLLLGQALVLDDQPGEALPLLERHVALFGQLYGPSERFVLSARRWHARAKRELGDPAAALAELDELRGLWLKKDHGLPQDYAWIESERARTLISLQRRAEAERALEDGMARVASTETPTGYWTLTLRDQLADTRLAQNDRAGAERLLRQNLDEARSVFKKGEWLLGWCAYRLGDRLAADDRTTEALPLLKEAVPILEASLGTDEHRTRPARERAAATAQL